MVKKCKNLVIFLIHVVFAAYFINSAIVFTQIPESILILNKWINFIGGILIFVGGINFYKVKIKKFKDLKEKI